MYIDFFHLISLQHPIIRLGNSKVGSILVIKIIATLLWHLNFSIIIIAQDTTMGNNQKERKNIGQRRGLVVNLFCNLTYISSGVPRS